MPMPGGGLLMVVVGTCRGYTGSGVVGNERH